MGAEERYRDIRLKMKMDCREGREREKTRNRILRNRRDRKEREGRREKKREGGK